ncbi:methyltransferase domain-containing protein [Photobacterium carnosum]|uniref:class I SAM-dependent methyltransferase n=1 Tax=Photobacterium carnosum TaxID=2023717 RepID=UPI001F15AC4F|nr:class I SAM-dependent methyltransferase [Photobacterium carnosum]MCF2155745.1 methyltransferase domain-containing protein [Photobacterium carnosum]MCF2217574.1 methyltransferase domain-containing protein [Photobacterium carnosum]
MERLDEELIKKNYLINEHFARYDCFSNYYKGVVVDCACGIGYASKIIIKNECVSQYLGVDISSESVEIANRNYKKENVSFINSSLLDLDLKADFADCFICMETLEHIDVNMLDQALLEILRVLTDNGIFIGSVPTKEFDDRCKEVYGNNPYHVTRFTELFLRNLLEKYFKYVNISIIGCQVISHLKSIENKQSDNNYDIKFHNKYDINHGSFIFQCSNEKIDIESDKIYMSQSLVEYDEEQVIPLFLSMKNAEKLALEREAIINEMSQAYEEKIDGILMALDYAEKLALEREVIINEMSQAYEERIGDILVVLDNTEKMALEREKIILNISSSYEEKIESLSQALNNKHES